MILSNPKAPALLADADCCCCGCGRSCIACARCRCIAACCRFVRRSSLVVTASKPRTAGSYTSRRSISLPDDFSHPLLPRLRPPSPPPPTVGAAAAAAPTSTHQPTSAPGSSHRLRKVWLRLTWKSSSCTCLTGGQPSGALTMPRAATSTGVALTATTPGSAGSCCCPTGWSAARPRCSRLPTTQYPARSASPVFPRITSTHRAQILYL